MVNKLISDSTGKDIERACQSVSPLHDIYIFKVPMAELDTFVYHHSFHQPLFFFFKDFIYLFDRDRDSQREREHKQEEWERKKQAHSRGA